MSFVVRFAAGVGYIVVLLVLVVCYRPTRRR